MNNNILSQINDLKTLTMKQLRQRWLVLFTTDPPAYGRAYLERRLAYRIQELAHGTDTARLERKMEEAAKGRLNKKNHGHKDIYRPVSGTRLTREWQGRNIRSPCWPMVLAIAARNTTVFPASPK
jgi:hypothetical protein